MADVVLTDKISYKRLVTAGNDDVWFEDIDVAAGTMIELDTSSGAIDTGDQLTVTSAFQKMFVANGANIKVADFINIKLTLAVFTTAPTRGSTIAQLTSNAEMIVDFVNGGLTEIYGYVTTGTFTTTAGHTISGGGLASGNSLVPASIAGRLTHAALTTTHTAGDILTQETSGAKMTVTYTDVSKTHTWGKVTEGIFTTTYDVNSDGAGDDGVRPTAVSTRPPVWYDWTQYGVTKALSTNMPTKAYLVGVYRARLVLAGNPEYPHQWYMSKVADPFNFTYGEDDPMSAVAGNNADAGQCPDIIRSLISFHDDYLIFGCASTIWVLRGDPVAGGSLDNLSDTTGMFGSNSWCFDDNRNLYFWGSGGLYMIKSDFSGIRNLTEMVLPDIINDEAADPSTHRITMGYDKKRHGIVVAITVLATGVNSNYFYSFKTQGFYPESYPDECGPYSLFYYDANDTTYADLLVGCKDGYIRKYLSTAKDDSTGATTTDAISSYVTYPITPLGETDQKGRLAELVFDLAGGGEGGNFSDTDSVSWRLYTGDDAETVLEKTKATTAWADGTNYVIGNLVTYGGLEYICIVAHLSATGAATHEEPDTNIIDWNLAAFTQGTLSGTGRKNKLRPRMRGAFMGLKLYNSTASETWALNRVLYNPKPAGRIK